MGKDGGDEGTSLSEKAREGKKILIYHYQLLIFAETILRQLWVGNEKKPVYIVYVIQTLQ